MAPKPMKEKVAVKATLKDKSTPVKSKTGKANPEKPNALKPKPQAIKRPASGGGSALSSNDKELLWQQFRISQQFMSKGAGGEDAALAAGGDCKDALHSEANTELSMAEEEQQKGTWRSLQDIMKYMGSKELKARVTSKSLVMRPSPSDPRLPEFCENTGINTETPGLEWHWSEFSVLTSMQDDSKRPADEAQKEPAIVLPVYSKKNIGTKDAPPKLKTGGLYTQDVQASGIDELVDEARDLKSQLDDQAKELQTLLDEKALSARKKQTAKRLRDTMEKCAFDLENAVVKKTLATPYLMKKLIIAAATKGVQATFFLKENGKDGSD